MTVNANDTVERFTVSGVGPYAYNFRIFAETDLRVAVCSTATPPVPTLLTYLSDYTVDGANVATGGTVLLVSDVAATYDGYTLDIRSVTPNTQPTSIRNIGRFLPEVHENAFDCLERQVQDHARQLQACVRYPDNVLNDAAMTPLSAWQSKYLTVNDSGIVTPAVLSSSVVTAATITSLLSGSPSDQTQMATLVSLQYDATGAVALNLQSYLDEDDAFNVLGFVPQNLKSAIQGFTSSADLDTYLQSWLDAMVAEDGRAGRIPRGLYNFTDSLTIAQSLVIRGSGLFGLGGSRLKFNGTGVGLTFSGGGNLNGLRLQDFVLQGTVAAEAGIEINNGYNGITLDHIVVEGFTRTSGTDNGTCLRLKDTFDIKLGGSQLRQSNNGIVGQIGTSGVVNTVWVRGCEFTGIANTGVLIRSGIGWRIKDSDFSGLATNAIGVDMAPGLTAGTSRGLKACWVRGGYMEKAGGATNVTGVRIGSGATIASAIQDNGVAEVYFDVSGDHVSVDKAYGTVIQDNHHGAVSGGKYKFNITANADSTKIVTQTRSDLNDLGVNTKLITNDVDSAREIDGNFTTPQRSAFQARPAAQITNVTGNNTVYTAIFTTEVYDRQAEYNNATGVFTAQKSGQYFFSATVTCTSAGSATSAQISLVTSNRTYVLDQKGADDAGGTVVLSGSAAADMDAADTATLTVQINGVGADSVDVETTSYFSAVFLG